MDWWGLRLVREAGGRGFIARAVAADGRVLDEVGAGSNGKLAVLMPPPGESVARIELLYRDDPSAGPQAFELPSGEHTLQVD